MTNSQTVPAQRVKNGKRIANPFAKARAMMAAFAALMAQGISQMAAQQQVGRYESLGKGKGKTARSAKKPPRNSWGSNRYPEQSARQARPKYYTATVNGFQIMQRMNREQQSEAMLEPAYAQPAAA